MTKYYPQSSRLIDICADYYKAQNIPFDVNNPDKDLYEKWIEYAFKDFKEVP